MDEAQELLERAERFWTQEQIARVVSKGSKKKTARETVGRWKRGVHQMKASDYVKLLAAVEREEAKEAKSTATKRR